MLFHWFPAYYVFRAYLHQVITCILLLQIDFTEYFLDFVFDDKVAILENGDIWDTESHFANIFTSHDFWGKLYFLEKIHKEQIIWLFLWINVSGDNITSSKSHKSYRPLTSKSILMTLTRLYILWFHVWLCITSLFNLFSSYFISIQQIDFNQPIWISFGQYTLTHPELQFGIDSVEKLHQTEKNCLHSEHHIQLSPNSYSKKCEKWYH